MDNPISIMSRPDDSQFLQTMGGIYNAGADLSDFVTSPRGLTELGATMLFPPAGLAFLGAEGVPGSHRVWKKNLQGGYRPASTS